MLNTRDIEVDFHEISVALERAAGAAPIEEHEKNLFPRGHWAHNHYYGL